MFMSAEGVIPEGTDPSHIANMQRHWQSDRLRKHQKRLMDAFTSSTLCFSQEQISPSPYLA